MQVLLAEDSGTMRRVIVKVVISLGFQAIESENGAESLIKLRKHAGNIALIILDWNMPIMDGYEVLQKIRSQEEYNHIPVLMATADGVEGNVVKALKAGANAYLVKPYTEDDLSQRISELVVKAASAR
jgi:two-component system chemotaxis response regulator CheY